MGYLRIILALSVVLAHSHMAAMPWKPLIPGELAVEIFFIVSGFYMSLVLSDKYRLPSGKIDLQAFWTARALRIYPCYWIVLAGLLVYFLLKNLPYFADVHSQGPLFAVWLAVSQSILFGLDGLLFIGKTTEGPALFQALGDLPGVQPYVLIAIPPAWTLSLELMFYLLVPFLCRLSSRNIMAIMAICVTLRTCAYMSGYNQDPWVYRFFPFELFFFLAGMMLHRIYASCAMQRRFYIIPLAISLMLFPFLPQTKILGYWLEGSVLLGTAMIALPALFHWSKNSVFDRKIGNLSYPLYVVHMPMMVVAGPYMGRLTDPILHTLAIILLSLAASCCLEAFIERILAFREKQKSLKSAS